MIFVGSCLMVAYGVGLFYGFKELKQVAKECTDKGGEYLDGRCTGRYDLCLRKVRITFEGNDDALKQSEITRCLELN